MAPSHSEESTRPKETMNPGQNIVHGIGDQQVSLVPSRHPPLSSSFELPPLRTTTPIYFFHRDTNMCAQLPSKVDRADKTAPLPEHEHGGAIPGMNASGGGSQGLAQGPHAGQGKGPLKPGV